MLLSINGWNAPATDMQKNHSASAAWHSNISISKQVQAARRVVLMLLSQTLQPALNPSPAMLLSWPCRIMRRMHMM